MCVIVIKPANVPLTREDIDGMYEQNPHGVGISYYNPKKNKMIWVKGLTDKDEIFEIMEKLYSVEAVIHFRYATSGPITELLCHPFPIGEENRLNGESDALFFQNGEIKSFEPLEENPEYSDVYLFWQQIINKIDYPLSPELKRLLGSNSNKVIIHDIYNGIDTAGDFYEWNGLKVSNLKFTKFLFEKPLSRKILSFFKYTTIDILNFIISGFTKLKNKVENTYK